MNLLFKPIALVLSLIAGRLAGKLFTKIWSRFGPDDAVGDGPPPPNQEDASARAVVAGAALQAAVAAGTNAAIERAGRRTVANLTGIWPGQKAGEPASDNGA